MVRNRISRVNCEHGQRQSECRTCLREWAEDQAWDRAVAEEIEAARLLGLERPDEHSSLVELVENYGGDEMTETWLDLLEAR